MSNAYLCLKCKKRKTCKAICRELKKILPKMNSGRMGGKLTSVPPHLIETRIYKSKIRGRRLMPKVYDDNWELINEKT